MFVTKIAVIVFLVAIVYAQDQGPAIAAASDNKGFDFVSAIRGIADTLTPEQRDQAKTIATNPLSTKQQVLDGLQSFFQGIGGDAETKYNALFEQFKTAAEKIGDKINENQSAISEEGKQLLSKSAEIHKNMNITFAEERKQLKELFDSASPEMKTKIQEIFGKLQALKGQNGPQNFNF